MKINKKLFKSVITKQAELEQTTFDNSESTSDRMVRFVFSSDRPDRDNDVILPQGIDFTDFVRNPIFLWQHDHQSTAIGKVIDLQVADNALVGTVEFLPSDFPMSGEQAEAALQLVKRGMMGTSIGFLPIEWTYDEQSDGVVYTKISLLEISCVNIPANADALAIIEPDGTEGSPLSGTVSEQASTIVSEDWINAISSELSKRLAEDTAYRERTIRLY